MAALLMEKPWPKPYLFVLSADLYPHHLCKAGTHATQTNAPAAVLSTQTMVWETNHSTMLQSPSHSHGAMMEGFREWCSAGCCVPKALWGYEPTFQQWGHKYRQTTASSGSVVALTAGNSLDNCSERCG